MGKIYTRPGQVHLVCPRLLELDPRHGEHLAGMKYPVDMRPDHVHGPDCDCLIDPEGHLVETFGWVAGGPYRPLEAHPVCRCGRRLVYGDLDDPHDPSILAEVVD